jgi:hypothetical protein
MMKEEIEDTHPGSDGEHYPDDPEHLEKALPVEKGDEASIEQNVFWNRHRIATTICLTLMAIWLALLLVGILVIRDEDEDSLPTTGWPLPPTNDRCEDAIELPTNGTVVEGTFSGAFREHLSFGQAFHQDDDVVAVWYKFDDANDIPGTTVIRVTGPAALLSIYTCDCNELACQGGGLASEEDCNNDGGNCWIGTSFGSYMLCRTFPKRTYYIAVAKLLSNENSFNISVIEYGCLDACTSPWT